MILVQIMFWAILGHFIGDYLMQSKKMALMKAAPGAKGIIQCVIHCFWYTTAVCLTLQLGMGWTSLEAGWNPLIALMVFLSHYPIDRWSLADKWLRLIKGRRLIDGAALAWGKDMANVENFASAVTAQSFAVVVYIVVDNTMHIILMTVGFAALLHWGMI